MNTPIDFAPMLSKIAMGGVVLAVMSIAAALVVLYVAQTGAGQFLGMLFNKMETHKKHQRYEQRYRREKSNQDYKQWKSSRDFIGPRRPRF